MKSYKDILSTKISWCANISSPASSPITVYESLRVFGEKYKGDLKRARDIYEEEGHGSETYKRIKASLPCFIYGGVCPSGSNPNDGNLRSSGLITIDIDQHDNEGIDLDFYREEILKMKGVVGVYKSLSGKGLWILLLVKFPDKARAHYKYFARLLEQKFGLNVDEQCKNLSRKRVLGYNPDWKDFTNLRDIEEFELMLNDSFERAEFNDSSIPSIFIKPPKPKRYINEGNDTKSRVHWAIEEAIRRGYYATEYNLWYYEACDCKAFDDGFDLFVRISNNNPKYKASADALRKKYNEAEPSIINDDLARKWFGILKRC